MLWVLPLLLQAAEPPPEPELDCEDARTQTEMNLCALRDFEASDAELNRQWPVIVALMKELDEGIEGADIRQPGHYQTLLEGQRAWLRYRDAQCLAESFEARGGSMQPMLDSLCRTYLTEQRIQQLHTLAAGFGR